MEEPREKSKGGEWVRRKGIKEGEVGREGRTVTRVEEKKKKGWKGWLKKDN